MPAEFIILAIGIVVPLLGAADLISPTQHRHALRKQQRRQHIPFLSEAQLAHGRIVGGTFNAAIPA
ncbi:MAG: hypothetical protein QM771_08710 [Nitrospira sp.]